MNQQFLCCDRAYRGTDSGPGTYWCMLSLYVLKSVITQPLKHGFFFTFSRSWPLRAKLVVDNHVILT
jgi:hypothetical protein